MTYKLEFTKQATKDGKKLAKTPYFKKAKQILEEIKHNPTEKTHHMEFLLGDKAGLISKRINIQHRLVYQIYEEKKTIRILRMWTHYE